LRAEANDLAVLKQDFAGLDPPANAIEDSCPG